MDKGAYNFVTIEDKLRFEVHIKEAVNKNKNWVLLTATCNYSTVIIRN
jgi:hypothetical protein